MILNMASITYPKNEQIEGVPDLGCLMWAKSRVDSQDSLIDSGSKEPKKLSREEKKINFCFSASKHFLPR